MIYREEEIERTLRMIGRVENRSSVKNKICAGLGVSINEWYFQPLFYTARLYQAGDNLG